jgi:hypothetical protein
VKNTITYDENIFKCEGHSAASFAADLFVYDVKLATDTDGNADLTNTTADL